MTRRHVVYSYERKMQCPACNRRFRKKYDLALHLAMKRDTPHEEWRLVRNLPVDYETMKGVRETASRIVKLLQEHNPLSQHSGRGN